MSIGRLAALLRLDIRPSTRRLRFPRSRRVAWGVAVVGPPLIILASLPFRSELGVAGVLFCVLLVVVVAAGIGGIGPASAAVAVGFVAGVGLYSRPLTNLPTNRPVDIVALVAFVVVGGAVGLLVDTLTRLADEQAALRRVATLVARGASSVELAAVVTEELGRVLPVDTASMGSYGPDGTISILSQWKSSAAQSAGGLLTPGGHNVGTLVSRTGLPARLGQADRAAGLAGKPAQRFRSSLGAPITVHGRLWGALAVASTEHVLPSETEELLASFADVLATGIANAESRAELALSRARIVAAADETRRQIERNLHDGAQQRLVALGLELRTAQAGIPPELRQLDAELSHVVEGLAAVQNELREIARGIHPAILAEGGLGPALKTLARRSQVPVELEVRTEARLGERVEVATYYVVSEALTNTAKHADATVMHVTVEAIGAVLHVVVRDDGSGGADPSQGSGLVGLKDRVESLGGRITVESPAGAGTTVRVELPLAEPA